jgi:hypothetical protein
VVNSLVKSPWVLWHMSTFIHHSHERISHYFMNTTSYVPRSRILSSLRLDHLSYSNEWCTLDWSSDIFTHRWVYFNCWNSQFQSLDVVSVRKTSLVLRIIPLMLGKELSCWHSNSNVVRVLHIYWLICMILDFSLAFFLSYIYAHVFNIETTDDVNEVFSG